MISFKNVSKNLKEFNVNDVSFEVAPGQVTYLVGNNGSGKTTLIKMALNILKKDRGEILFNKLTFNQEKQNIFFIEDYPNFYEDYSGYDNISFIAKNNNIARLKELQELLTLSNKLLHKKVYTYSFGERKKLAILLAFLDDYKYLILDEPTIGLDFISWNICKSLINYAKKSNCSILVTGHNYEMLEEIADNIVLIDNGSIQLKQPLKNFISGYDSIFSKLKSLY